MKKRNIILTCIVLIGISNSSFSQSNPFIPSDFKIPDTLENQHFRIRMLTVNDIVKDYDAIMSSIDHLQGVFGPQVEWPSKDMTLEKDSIDLDWHQKEFLRRSSFAYTVVTLDESQVIGCLYIFPTSMGDYNARIDMWVRSSAHDKGLDNVLFNTVKLWISEEWPFEKVAYPVKSMFTGFCSGFHTTCAEEEGLLKAELFVNPTGEWH